MKVGHEREIERSKDHNYARRTFTFDLVIQNGEKYFNIGHIVGYF